MSDAIRPLNGQDELVRPSELYLDTSNPRIPDLHFESEENVLSHLLTFADVEELVQSILSSGWLDFEPLVVERGTNIVLEGNRRLAALRLIADPALRTRLNFSLPGQPTPESQPERIRVRYVDSRAEARAYIGFKHINGPAKWDALAKAKYAAEWYSETQDIEPISRQLGDSHNTVARLVNGWIVLHQAESIGFNRANATNRRFPFSHLYTALARPNVRAYLGLDSDEISAVLPKNPVPKDHVHQLEQVMSWLFGQRSEPAVIRTQNPDLNHFVEVLGKEPALATLIDTRDLRLAFEQVEDKAEVFGRNLRQAIRFSEDTLKLVGSYDGRQDVMSAADNLRRTVLSLHRAMKSVRDRIEEGDADDAAE